MEDKTNSIKKIFQTKKRKEDRIAYSKMIKLIQYSILFLVANSNSRNQKPRNQKPDESGCQRGTPFKDEVPLQSNWNSDLRLSVCHRLTSVCHRLTSVCHRLTPFIKDEVRFRIIEIPTVDTFGSPRTLYKENANGDSQSLAWERGGGNTRMDSLARWFMHRHRVCVISADYQYTNTIIYTAKFNGQMLLALNS